MISRATAEKMLNAGNAEVVLVAAPIDTEQERIDAWVKIQTETVMTHGRSRGRVLERVDPAAEPELYDVAASGAMSRIISSYGGACRIESPGVIIHLCTHHQHDHKVAMVVLKLLVN